MRVLAVTNMYPSASRPSFGAFVKSQVDSLARMGHAVEVLFIDGSASTANYLTGFAAVGRTVRRFAPDVIHAHYGLTGFVAAYPRRPVPLVLSLCGDDVLGTPDGRGGRTARSRLGLRLSRLACARASGIIVKSGEMQQVVASWGFPAASVVPNGVDVEFFAPPTAAGRIAARQRLGLDPDRLQVLFPHTPYERRKRVDLAEQVVARYGHAAELQVVYHRAREVLRDYYHAADIMVLTSEWEGSPNVVKEAMACDLPTVSFDVGDVAWLTAGCRAHRVVPRYDVDAMVEVMAGILQSGVRDGSARIREMLSAEAIAARVTAIYEAARGQL